MTAIRPAQPTDTRAIAGLMDELYRHYGGGSTDPIEVQVAQIDDALFGPTATGHAILVWDESTLIGIAAYSFLWPAAGLTRSLLLKEIYVTEAHRRGVEKILMDEVHSIARNHGCSRVEWTADVDDTSARDFYDELGYKPSSEQIFYRSVL